MTHVLDLSVEVRRSEQLWQILDIGKVSRPTFGFKSHNNFNVRNENTKKNCNFPNFYLPTHVRFAPPYTYPELVQNLLSDRLWAPHSRCACFGYLF